MTSNTAFGVSTPVNSRSINNAFDAVLNNGYDFSKIVVTGDITASTGTLISLTVTGDLTVDTNTLKIDSTNNAVGINGAAIASYGLRIASTGAGTGATGAALLLNGTVVSTMLNYRGVFQAPIYPASMTASTLYEFLATVGVVPTTSSIGTVVGFRAENTLSAPTTGGTAVVTNAYGFQGVIASATNRYNLYMSGTAQNYLAGNTGIATATPSYPLDVNGTTRTVTAIVTGNGISYTGCTIGGGTANDMGLRWDSASSSIIGTVDNSVSAVLGTVSDRRFKTNIETLQNGLSTVKQLRPVTYSPLDVIGFDQNNEIIIGDKPPDKTLEGFIADEVEQVAPWLVQGGENGGYQSVNYALITPMLVRAVQELEQRLTELEAA